MLPIGLSSCGKTLTDASLAAMREAGVTHLEISLPYEEYPTLDCRELAARARRADLLLWSFHLPFCPFSQIDISHPDLAKASITYLSELIARAADVGIETFVIHASGEPIAEDARAERMRNAQASLVQLADFAATQGGRIAVENLPRTCLGRDSADILALTDCHSALRVCYDTNHLLSEPAEQFIAAVGSRTVTTHISDYDYTDEKHWLPGEGKVDWQALYRRLTACGYRGPWLYELGYTAPESHPRKRELTPADFVRNAREIFAGEPLTTVE